MRIRAIKPQFWRSDDVTDLDAWDRLLFIALWSYVDDNGVGRDSVTDIVADCFAPDLARNGEKVLENVSDGLDVLAGKGMIERYNGVVLNRPDKFVPLLFVTGWEYHQKISRPNLPRFSRPPIVGTPVLTMLSNVGTAVITMPNGDIVECPLNHPEPAGESVIADLPDEMHAISLSGRRKKEEGTGEKGTGNIQHAQHFDEFWKAYPRRIQKAEARRVWHRLFTKDPNLNPQHIVDGAKRYANDPDRSDKYTQYPTTWLNKTRWEDEYNTPKTMDWDSI